MFQNLLLMGVFVCIGTTTYSQKDIPTSYFDLPLKIPIELSGTFGELRNNHFHSGLDIKTLQKEGIPVYAPADGHVSRIKVSHFGYGKALYIQHPNGYSTVYAHLREYAGAIQDFVKKIQYQRESYEVEMFPEADFLPVKKGDLIGFTGNTGGSGGPHLHYEIRDAHARPMNPLLFGIDVADTRLPVVKSVFVYPISDDAQVNQNANPMRLKLIPQSDGMLLAEKIQASGKLGFAVSAFDRQNAGHNQNGIYSVKTSFNGEKVFEVKMDKFTFAETRYINRFIDYKEFKNSKDRHKKLFLEENNPLSVITSHHQRGYVEIEDGFDSIYTIEVFDFKGNRTLISVPIEGKKQSIVNHKELVTSPFYVNAQEGTSIRAGKFVIYIPPKAVYEDAYLNINSQNNELTFHHDEIPIHYNVTITADISNYEEADLDKVYIARLSEWGRPYYVNSTRKGDKLSINTRTFGNYKLMADVTPPEIVPLNFSNGRWISNNKTLEIKIEDKDSGIKGYRATLNGKWILMEYEYKKNLLTFDFADDINEGTEYNLKLIVTDNVGNSSIFEATFYRK
ncbi:MAG TPA: M23 family metallopeptidase [Flavobacteriaceae bacterium]|nr:M23 family metallopeptidase [Flavobacteriaceae bacterium]